MISDIVSMYRGRGLRGSALRDALARHARILDGQDAGDAAALRARANQAVGKNRPKRKSPKRHEADPERAAWLAHDRAHGL